jgi:hypothetical protein
MIGKLVLLSKMAFRMSFSSLGVVFVAMMRTMGRIFWALPYRGRSHWAAMEDEPIRLRSHGLTSFQAARPAPV